VGLTAYSDRRIKDSIKENIPGLAFISRLRPVTYHLNLHKENQILGVKEGTDYPGKYDVEKITQSGFIAQEVDEAAKACGYDFSGVSKPTTSNELYALSYTTFVVPVVKAIQELKAENDSLKLANNIQAIKLDALQKAQAKSEQEMEQIKKLVYTLTEKADAQTIKNDSK
jgi:hypothetical protein